MDTLGPLWDNSSQNSFDDLTYINLSGWWTTVVFGVSRNLSFQQVSSNPESVWISPSPLHGYPACSSQVLLRGRPGGSIYGCITGSKEPTAPSFIQELWVCELIQVWELVKGSWHCLTMIQDCYSQDLELFYFCKSNKTLVDCPSISVLGWQW